MILWSRIIKSNKEAKFNVCKKKDIRQMSDSQTLAQIQTLLFHCNLLLTVIEQKGGGKISFSSNFARKKQLHFDYQIMILWSRIISFIFPHRLEINCKVILRIVSNNAINSLNFCPILRSKRLIICCQIQINWRSERQIKASNRLSILFPRNANTFKFL